MGANITSKHSCIILDACCVMNLYASGKMEEILTSVAEMITVAVYVVNVEALTVYAESKKTASGRKEIIDLQPFIEKGVLVIVDFESDEEKSAFVEFTAQRLDDGEATTMAIAVNRNWAVATDDRRAKRIIQTQYNSIQVVSTPEIIKHWQESERPETDILRKTIMDIERKANFLLGNRHPHYTWWESCKE